MTLPTVADVTLGTKVTLHLDWNARPAYEVQIDLDASAIACKIDPPGSAPKVHTHRHFIFYNNLRSPEGLAEHTGDNLTGTSATDDEVIRFDLAKAPQEVVTIVLAVSIYEADLRHQSFEQANAVVKIVDVASGTTAYSYNLSDKAPSEYAVVFGAILKQGADWKFHFSGQSSPSGLAGIARQYGIEV